MKEEYIWDIALITVFLIGGFYFQGARASLDAGGCQAYWSEYRGINISQPSVTTFNRSSYQEYMSDSPEIVNESYESLNLNVSTR